MKLGLPGNALLLQIDVNNNNINNNVTLTKINTDFMLTVMDYTT